MKHNDQMELEQIFELRKGRVLSEELIADILRQVDINYVHTHGLMIPASEYEVSGDHDKRLVFDDKERVGQWVADMVEQTTSWGSFYAMGIESGGELIAGAVFNGFNDSNATAHIAISRTNKLLPKFLYHCTYYAFIYCGLNRLTGLVESDNKKALAFDKRIGFEHEYTMKKGGSDGQDLEVLVMWRDTCPWIKGELA